MKYLSKLFATALVSLLAMGGVAQAQDMKFFGLVLVEPVAHIFQLVA